VEEETRRDERSDAKPADQGEAAYRGFLFADLRGYTAFVERYGDSAAADLLDAYRELVRAEVARHAGAEIRTEGDSFYVVFASARRAVACGLAIVAAAEQASRDHQDRPIRVGIGINAGETVQRGEGFVGTAVNLAARVCAQAREGEVLVTVAVRDALGATPDLRLVARGTRRLKGIARPVPLFAVRRGERPPSRRRLFADGRRLAILPMALVLALVIGAVWMATSGSVQQAADGSPDPVVTPSVSASLAPTASASPTADPDAYPNAAESDLLAAVGDDIKDSCHRADVGDRPVFVDDPQFQRDMGLTAEERVAAHVGIACEIPSGSAPDTFHLWVTRGIIDFRSVDVPKALIFSLAGRNDIPQGDCADGGPAYDVWELGDVSGWFMCRDVFGDAVIEWSYDGRALYGQATRRDGDLASLLEWWADEGRFIRP
jgi:class 3 adenylate cyclase